MIKKLLVIALLLISLLIPGQFFNVSASDKNVIGPGTPSNTIVLNSLYGFDNVSIVGSYSEMSSISRLTFDNPNKSVYSSTIASDYSNILSLNSDNYTVDLLSSGLSYYNYYPTTPGKLTNKRLNYKMQFSNYYSINELTFSFNKKLIDTSVFNGLDTDYLFSIINLNNSGISFDVVYDFSYSIVNNNNLLNITDTYSTTRTYNSNVNFFEPITLNTIYGNFGDILLIDYYNLTLNFTTPFLVNDSYIQVNEYFFDKAYQIDIVDISLPINNSDFGNFSGIGSFLSKTLGSFFNFQIMPGLSIGLIFGCVVGLGLLILILKMFLGG